MEIIRIKQDGKESCYIRCEAHNYFYNARPPETKGCTSCWFTFYMGQRATCKPEQMDAALAELDTALLHMQEEIAKGGFDLQLLDQPIVEISHED